MPTFHPEQRKVAQEILTKFNLIPFIVLLAQMQSGKTSAYLYLAFEMIRLGMVQRVVVICGSAETSLRDQAKSDAIAMRDEYQMNLLEKGDTDGMRTLLKGDINVYFSNEIKKIPKITDHTLVIHEECHMAQSKNNKPYKEFYKRNNIEETLLGDFRKLREQSNYILGVSATPFSEIVSNYKDEKFASMEITPEEKDIVPMKPGSGYLGVPHFYNNGDGSIQFTSQSVDTTYSHFFDVLDENREKYQDKYCIVRTFESKETHETIIAGCAKVGYDCIHSFAGEESIQEILSNEPVNPTVIHISGRCRMGQVLIKDHIGMVYESSRAPNADTLLQGLVGRVCGYDSSLDIDVYVSNASEEFIKEYSNAWKEDGTVDIDILGKIDRAMNLRSGGRKTSLKAKDKDGLEIMPIHPIRIPGYLLDLNREDDLGWQVHQCLTENPHLMKCPEDEDEIKRILLDSGKFHRSFKTNHIQDEDLMNSSIENHKRIRPGKLKSIQDCPSKFSLMEKPFILYKRKDGNDYYLGGWVPYIEEIHQTDEGEKPKPKVNPICNHVPGEEPEQETTSTSTANTKSSSKTKSTTSSSSTKNTTGTASTTATDSGNLCEVYEFGSLPKKSYYVDTTEEFIETVRALARMGINSYKRPDDVEEVPVFLKKSVFSKEETEKIKKQMKTELGIKMTIKGYPGRPSKSDDYRKMQTITW